MFSFQVIQAHFVILALSKIFVEITGIQSGKRTEKKSQQKHTPLTLHEYSTLNEKAIN
jgi:hypothetical protein